MEILDGEGWTNSEWISTPNLGSLETYRITFLPFFPLKFIPAFEFVKGNE